MSNAIKKSEAAEAPAGPRTIPAIEPAQVKRNGDGFAFQSYLIRLPSGVILQDLNDAPRDLWRSVQSNPNTALRQFDVVRLVEFDEAWMAEATVAQADGSQVTLAGIKKFDLPGRSANLYSDDTYAVRWAGDGYSVFRRGDSVRMSPQSFHTPDAAKAALLGLYPKRSAA